MFSLHAVPHAFMHAIIAKCFADLHTRILIKVKSASVQNVSSSWLPWVRKWSGENNILQGQEQVGEFYFESGKIDILNKMIPLIHVAGRELTGECDLSDVFFGK